MKEKEQEQVDLAQFTQWVMSTPTVLANCCTIATQGPLIHLIFCEQMPNDVSFPRQRVAMLKQDARNVVDLLIEALSEDEKQPEAAE